MNSAETWVEAEVLSTAQAVPIAMIEKHHLPSKRQHPRVLPNAFVQHHFERHEAKTDAG